MESAFIGDSRCLQYSGRLCHTEVEYAKRAVDALKAREPLLSTSGGSPASDSV